MATVLLTATSFAPSLGHAAPGDLDTSFHADGKVITDFGGDDGVHGIAIQRDGKIVAVGQFGKFNGSTEFALARYRGNGKLDPRFGEKGRVSVSFDGEPRRYGIAEDVAIQTDGKIVAAGFVSGFGSDSGFSPPDATTPVGLAVIRFRPDGRLDRRFADNGIFISNRRKLNIAYAVALQDNGKIVVAGQAFDPTGISDVALARLLPNGKLDRKFGRHGVVITNFGGANDFARAIALQPDGKIVIAGRGDSGFGSLVFALARYLPNGKLDTTFGAGGLVTTFVGQGYEAMDLVLQPDGKLVVLGQSFAAGTDLAVVRYDTYGSLDPAFGVGGQVTVDLGETELGNAVALQEDGKIVIAGRYSDSSGAQNFVIARLNSNGSLDASFGNQGHVLTNIGESSQAQADDIAVQKDGKIVAAGFARDSEGGGDFAVARYHGDEVP